GWEKYKGNTYVTRVGNGIFGDYNPYQVVVKGDWYFANNPVHTGDVYVDGHSLYEVLSMDEVLEPVPFKMSWEPDEVTVKKWYTEQDGDDTLIYVNIGDDPSDHLMEFNVRRNCFMPDREGIDYITVSGFVLKQAATTWAPPTAYQDGLIGPHWSKGWIIEDCEVSDSRCSGISLGKYLQPNNENKWTRFGLKDGTQTQRDCVMQAFSEGWNKENIGSHIIRNCEIHHCGQTGIVGHLGGVFSIIEDNHIHHINNKQDLAGAEIGGIKMHAAIDVIYRRNHIHHCTRGMWLDWQAQGTRVYANLFHDNTPPKGTDITPLLGLGEDIFVEVSHGPTLLDNNLFLSPCACRISTQGVALVHNIIAGSFTWVDSGVENGGAYLPTPRYTPYHIPHQTDVAGFMTFMHGDMRFYNNIFIQQPVNDEYVEHAKKTNEVKQYNFKCGLGVYKDYPTTEEYMSHFGPWKPTDEGAKDKYYEHLPVDAAGNAYFNGAESIEKEKNAYVDNESQITFELKETEKGITFISNLGDHLPGDNCSIISTATLGEAFEPEQRFENPDGSEIIFNEDFFGERRSQRTIPGPFSAVTGEDLVLFH
ncbi:MAG: right-handed parallel beta-helix repeat-containing protein, partial [Lachnospiraceae bacterium]|nr:right-handed parallel beta-helix repeat-containing protein [Lachnospiraceae bacterium]